MSTREFHCFFNFVGWDCVSLGVHLERARELLVQLTALLGQSEEKANRATIKAQCTEEFARKQEARDTRELVLEMIRGLKYMLRSLDTEMQLMVE